MREIKWGQPVRDTLIGAYTLVGSRVWLEMQFVFQPVMFRFWGSPETVGYPDFQCCTLMFDL